MTGVLVVVIVLLSIILWRTLLAGDALRVALQECMDDLLECKAELYTKEDEDESNSDL